MLDIVVSYHCMRFQGKLQNQIWDNGKKLVLGLILAHLVPPKNFFKNLAPSVTRYHVQLSSCTTSEKTNDPVLRKLRDRQINRGTDRRVILLDSVCLMSNIQKHSKKAKVIPQIQYYLIIKYLKIIPQLQLTKWTLNIFILSLYHPKLMYQDLEFILNKDFPSIIFNEKTSTLFNAKSL